MKIKHCCKYFNEVTMLRSIYAEFRCTECGAVWQKKTTSDSYYEYELIDGQLVKGTYSRIPYEFIKVIDNRKEQ